MVMLGFFSLPGLLIMTASKMVGALGGLVLGGSQVMYLSGKYTRILTRQPADVPMAGIGGSARRMQQRRFAQPDKYSDDVTSAGSVRFHQKLTICNSA